MGFNELFLEFNKSKEVVSVDGITVGILLHEKANAVKDVMEESVEVDSTLALLSLVPLDFSRLLKAITQDFKLQLVLQKSEANVCLMGQNEELRDEFKVVFYVLDVVDYIYGLSCSSRGLSLISKQWQSVSLPKSIARFWNLVRLGRMMRETLYGDSNLSVVEKRQILESLTCKADAELI